MYVIIKKQLKIKCVLISFNKNMILKMFSYYFNSLEIRFVATLVMKYSTGGASLVFTVSLSVTTPKQ